MEAFFWFLAGFLFSAFYERIAGRKKKESEKVLNPSSAADTVTPSPQGEGLDPMSLRNGYGVTKDKNPTFAEQWVNIMNYDGRNQKEEDYGEGEDYTAEDLG